MSRAPKPPEDKSNSRNEYIPSFISKAPFYATGTDEDYLEHQRLQSLPTDTLDKAKWYSRGQKAAPAATKFRKGACENCGAMTHKTKECLSRPRKQGARWTGKDIQADEVVEEVKLGWDAKRDRWNGYDAREYSAVVKEYEELEAIKKAAANKDIDSQQHRIESNLNAETDSNADDSTRYAEETDMGRNQPTSTRQLRLREDTAKYLINLDLESARYDPKTRSMDTAPSATDDASDGFVRPAALDGDAATFEQAQRYAWETQEGTLSTSTSTSAPAKKLHLQANPTEGELLLKQKAKDAEEKRAARKALLAERYGVSSTSPLPSTSVALNQITSSSTYVEYDASGRIKGSSESIARSKYPEDVYPNNHTSVFGSGWANFQWGYSCCHSFVKNSYCTGEQGKRAFEETERLRLGEGEDNSESEMLMIENGHEDAKEKTKQQRRQQQDADEGERKEVNNNNADPSDTKSSEVKKRTLQEMRQGITEDEMESYKKSRLNASDPMANMLGKDELLT